jgi:hypothetical protein
VVKNLKHVEKVEGSESHSSQRSAHHVQSNNECLLSLFDLLRRSAADAASALMKNDRFVLMKIDHHQEHDLARANGCCGL